MSLGWLNPWRQKRGCGGTQTTEGCTQRVHEAEGLCCYPPLWSSVNHTLGWMGHVVSVTTTLPPPLNWESGQRSYINEQAVFRKKASCTKAGGRPDLTLGQSVTSAWKLQPPSIHPGSGTLRPVTVHSTHIILVPCHKRKGVHL